MQSQIFGYVFAIIVAALVLLFGFKALYGVGEQAELSRYAEFKAELEADISSIGLQFGSARRVTYDVTGGISELCFFAPSDTPSNVDDSCQTLSNYPLIRDSLGDNFGKNVFILGELPEMLALPYVDTGICPLRCFSVSRGAVSVLLEGRGNKTLILS